MISQHKSPNETLKEESIKSFKELINDKAKNSSNNSSNSNNSNDNNNLPASTSSSSSNDNYDQQLINLCQEYIELD
jgi:hypothetical protein